MRDNHVKHHLADGGSAFGTMVFEFFSPGMAQIAAAAGAEFVLYDMEHSGVGLTRSRLRWLSVEGWISCRWCVCRRRTTLHRALPGRRGHGDHGADG